MEAQNNPVKRQYNRKETHTTEMDMAQPSTADLDVFERGDSFIDIVQDFTQEFTTEQKDKAREQWMKAMRFMEEPMTIRIEENSNSEFPETCVPVYCNGIAAEVWNESTRTWLKAGWLPIGTVLTVKRKTVEILARSRPESIRTLHTDGSLEERTKNRLERRQRSAYPLSIIRDDNPAGHEWLARIMARHA